MAETAARSEFGAHPSHCCLRHGCKYGEEACPVATGVTQQTYPCEYCLTPEDARKKLAKALDEFAWSCTLLGRLFPERVVGG